MHTMTHKHAHMHTLSGHMLAFSIHAEVNEFYKGLSKKKKEKKEGQKLSQQKLEDIPVFKRASSRTEWIALIYMVTFKKIP